MAERGRKLDRLIEDELHALRKSLKALHHGIASLGGLYGRKRFKAYAQRCKELQEGLGAFNDAAVAEDLACKLGETDPARLAAPAEALTQWSRERRDGALRHLAEGWHEFEAAPAFWR